MRRSRWRASLQTGWLRARQTMVSILIRPARAAGVAERLFGGGADAARERTRRRIGRLQEIAARLMAATAPAHPVRLTRRDGRWLGLCRALVSGRYVPLEPGARFLLLADLVASAEVRFDGDVFTVHGLDAG